MYLQTFVEQSIVTQLQVHTSITMYNSYVMNYSYVLNNSTNAMRHPLIV